MAAITIRRLEEGVIERIKADAKLHGRSMEEEARMALSRVYPPMLHGQAAIDYADAVRREIWGGRVQPDSTPLIRELREEDPAAWSGK
jgi:plasmid stability protein